ncbi:MAG: hypothetical protein K2N73_11465 [Lachnospiraceae bacterium]|nr:hypothetical protein [Lachnospiraceae bacterium]
MKKHFYNFRGKINKRQLACVIACAVNMGMLSGCAAADSGGLDAAFIMARTDSSENMNEMDSSAMRETQDSEVNGDVVPDIVKRKAEEIVEQRFLSGKQRGDSYLDWRIESLGHVYTYDDFNGMILQVYCLNYQFLSENPEELLLAGGMSVVEDGWVNTEYENSNYLIYRQDGDSLSYMDIMFENDCYPGDETFTSDMQWRCEMEN